MAVLPTTRGFRPEQVAIRIARESIYGVENPSVSDSGEFLGLITNFAPPDARLQLETVRGPRPSDYTPSGGVINDVFSRHGVRNWIAAYPKAFELTGSFDNITLVNPCIFRYVLGDVSVDQVAEESYMNSMKERIVIPSFTLEATYYNNIGNNVDNLRIRYIGCKINSMTIMGQEGKPVSYSMTIVAKDVRHNIAEVASDGTQRLWLGYDSVLESIEGANPLEMLFNQDVYNFSGGQIQIYVPEGQNQPQSAYENSSYGRIADFSLTINNNLEPQYYIQNFDQFGSPSVSEFVEGDREYKLVITAAADDQDFFKLLMQNGYYAGERRGIGIKIRYDRILQGNFGNTDYVEFRMPASTKIAGRTWSATSFSQDGTATGPIAGMEANNPVLGCFLVSAPHTVNLNDSLVLAKMEFEVPSLEIDARMNIKCAQIQTSTYEDSLPDPPIPDDVGVPVWIVYEV